jgi:DNA-binding XRE family transcriptional regulator
LLVIRFGIAVAFYGTAAKRSLSLGGTTGLDKLFHVAQLLRPMEHPLRAFRRKKGLSLDQAAEALDIAKSSMSRIENGKQVITSDLMRRILEWTDGAVTPNDLVQFRAPEAAA